MIARMTKQDAREWVAALRSGNYAQQTGRLQRSVRYESGTSTGYCCLGVYCEIKRIPTHTVDVYDHTRVSYDFDGSICETSMPGYILDKLVQDDLIKMNDDERCSFAVIATHIENNIIPTLGGE